MKKLSIGDLFEINTPNGKAYFQYVFENKTLTSLIRVLEGLYQKQPENINELIKKQEVFLIHFPLKAAYRKKIVKVIGNYDIPKHFKLPKFMRSKKVDKDGNLISWQIVNYKTWHRENVNILNEEQKKLSPWGTWNDTMLIEKLIKEWTLEEW